MPKHVETYNALVKAIKKINPASTKTAVTPDANKAIVWSELDKYGKSFKEAVQEVMVLEVPTIQYAQNFHKNITMQKDT